jgi:acetyltransferase-like isoleucine patch superfamily enzyme
MIPAGYAFRRLRGVLWRVLNGRRYRELGRGAIVVKPIHVTPRFIRLGQDVVISVHARIEGVAAYEGVAFTPEIVFDEGASAQQNLHLTCAEKVYIGKETALAANVTITDIDHGYEDVERPVERQPLKVRPVRIGQHCKIYNNAVILPGTTIGDHCVVGANSVVSGRFPSFSVIVGSPARTVKRYDPETRSWVRVEKPAGSSREPAEAGRV